METYRTLVEDSLSWGVIVATVDRRAADYIDGVHASCSTFVSDEQGVFSEKPVATYVNPHAARVGHDVVIETLTRRRLEERAIANGSHRALAEGAL